MVTVFMYLVSSLVLLQIVFFLVIFTGELTNALYSRLAETYRNNQHRDVKQDTSSLRRMPSGTGRA